MHAAFGGGNTVGVSVDAFVVTRVPLNGDVELHAFFFVFIFKRSNFVEERFLRLVEVLDEVDNATLVLEGLGLFSCRTLIFENNFEALVEERHCLQALHDCARNKLCSFGRKNCWVWIEGDRRAGLASFCR